MHMLNLTPGMNANLRSSMKVGNGGSGTLKDDNVAI